MLARKPKGAVEKRRSGGVASLLWMFVGAVLTLMFGLFLYLWNPFDIGSETKTEERTVEPKNQTTSQSDDYEFYDLLPEQEITSIPDEAIVRDDDFLEDIDNLEPDVIITTPDVQQRNNTDSANSGNYGISEDTILNPMDSQNSVTNNADQDIVIIEEEGTYDEPLEGSGTQSSPNQNSTGQNSTGQNSTGQGTSGQSTSRPNNAAATRSNTAKPVAPKLSYILQINSFSNAQEADKRRAQVLMAGVDAHVVKNKTVNGQVVYQVVSSTMTNRQSVIAAQQKLQNNGIDSLIVEQRR